MGKLRLELDPEFDFRLICISSQEKDYRFCWGLNQATGIRFERINNLSPSGKDRLEESYPAFEFEDPDMHIQYRLINNRFGKNVFQPELHEFNFLLLVKGELQDERFSRLMEDIHKTGMVFFAEEADPGKLKNKNDLLY